MTNQDIRSSAGNSSSASKDDSEISIQMSLPDTCVRSALQYVKLDGDLSTREQLFEYSLKVAENPNLYPPPTLTVMAIIVNTIEGMSQAASAMSVILQWFKIVCSLVDATDMKTLSAKDWKDLWNEDLSAYVTGLRPDAQQSILRFVGVQCSGRRKIKSGLIEFLINITAASARYLRMRTSKRPLTNLWQSPELIKDIFFISNERTNPRKGFRPDDYNQVKQVRSCRFCDSPIVQIQPRKRPLRQSKKEIDDSQQQCSKVNVEEILDQHTSSGETKSVDGSYFDPVQFFHRRKTFCDNACLFLYRIGASQSCLRDAVFARDRGVCASCHEDTLAFLQRVVRQMKVLTEKSRDAVVHHFNYSETPLLLELIATAIFDAVPSQWLEDNIQTPADIINTKGPLQMLCRRAVKRIQSSPRKEVFRKVPRFGVRQGDLWQADHIVPVVLHGGEAALTISFRTLCFVCHRVVTHRLMSLKKTKSKASHSSTLSPVPPIGDTKRRQKVGRWYKRT